MKAKRGSRRQKLPSRPDYCPPLAISVHGIRTHGEWQKVFAAVVSGSSCRVDAFSYGRYGLFRFLSSRLNWNMVDRFYEWYGNTVRSCPTVDLDHFAKRPSVVAHSLGTWIVGNAMIKFEDMRFDKIVFAGSILPRDFDWGTLFAREQAMTVRNEYGLKDPWPRWASRMVKHTGTAGSEGFDWFSSAVENIRCDWFEHSDALMRQHIERFWIPFLNREPIPLSLLHGRDIHDGQRFSDILDHTGTIIDAEAFGDLPHYGEVEIPRGLSLTWIRVNPDIYTFLIDRESGSPAGYINAMPVDDKLYAEIRAGKVADNKVFADAILPFNGSIKRVKVYMMSIAVAEKYRRWGDGISQQAYFQLLTGFLDKLTHYGKNYGTRVTHFLATAWTPEGRRICELFRMNAIGNDQFGDAIFELDLATLRRAPERRLIPALRQLLKVYDRLSP